MWLWYLEFNTGSTLIWVRLISFLKKVCKTQKSASDKVFSVFQIVRRKMLTEIEWKLLSPSRNSATFQKSWVIRFSIVQIVRTKMVAEVVRRAGVKILKCFWQNTPWPDTGKNVLIVQPFLVKFYFSGWRIQWPPYQDHPCWLLWSRGLD